MRIIISALAVVSLIGCSNSPSPQASAGAASGGACFALPSGERECVGKCIGDVCDGAAGDPIYRVCGDDGACRFPKFTCEETRPGADCEGGRCSAPIVGCDGPPCVSVSYCCTGCLDSEDHCAMTGDQQYGAACK